MEILGWMERHGVDLLQTASLLVGLFATIHTISADTRERKIENLFAITAAHRELWIHFSKMPALHRILDDRIDLNVHPPTISEVRFIHELILHLRTSFRAKEAGMEFDDEAVASDIRQFFSKPIPQFVWERSKEFQGRDFIEFVEYSLRGDNQG